MYVLDEWCSEITAARSVLRRADGPERRMFGVIGRNSFQRQIGAFTFDIISE